VKKTNHGIVVIVISIDDLIIIRDSDVDIFDLKKLLNQKFKMKDLGELRYFLDIEVIQSPKGIWLIQRQCLEQIVRIWDDGLQTHFNSIAAKCEAKCR
jgi:hypothetical protein